MHAAHINACCVSSRLLLKCIDTRTWNGEVWKFHARKPWFTQAHPSHLYMHASVHVTHDNNVRCSASRHFRNKKEEYVKATIDDLESNTKLTNIRDMCIVIGDFKKGYQPTTTIVKVEKAIENLKGHKSPNVDQTQQK